MAYFAEFGIVRGEDFYQEFIIYDRNTGCRLSGLSVNHELILSRAEHDHGFCSMQGQVVASDDNGLIVQPEVGLLAATVPAASFASFLAYGDGGYWHWSGHDPKHTVLRCRLNATNRQTATTKTLFTGTISIGDRLMPNPRLQLGTFPMYPAPAVPQCLEVAQIKQELNKVAGRYDQVEAALLGPVDPATISWNTGGVVCLGGPLLSLISATLNWDDTQMQIFMVGASKNSV